MTRPLIIDFETYFDKDYSLRHMPTAQYVRDPRFRVLGAAVGYAGAPSQYLEGPALGAYLQVIDWSQTVAVAHNAQFDGLILAERYGFRPYLWLDTMLMARYAIAQGILPPDARTGLAWFGERYGRVKGDTAQAVAAGGQELRDYALDDWHNTDDALRELFPHVPPLELRLMDLHVRMATEAAFALDAESLRPAAEASPPPEAELLRSRDVFANALRACGVEPGTKTSARTGKASFAFGKKDEFMRSLERHPDPRVRMLHELRTGGASTILQSRAQRFLDVGGPLPVPLLYYGAHTGRSSGQDSLNLQNLPRSGPLRNAIMAPEGHSLVVIDLSQIEVRVLAWLAGEQWLLDAFERDDEVYIRFAVKLYGGAYEERLARYKDGDKAEKATRSVAKAAVLALGFGQGPGGFLAYCEGYNTPMDLPTAERTVEVYRASHPRIVQLWRTLMTEATANKALRLPSGRLITYPGLRNEGREVVYDRHSIFSKSRTKRDTVKLWPGLCAENVTQATARDVVMEQTAKLAQRYRVALSVHDEAVLVVPTEQAEEARQFALGVFAEAPSWALGLPVKGEAHIVQRYGEAK